MTHTNICKSKEKDYFVLESMMSNATLNGNFVNDPAFETLKGLGIENYLIFNNDGTAEIMEGELFNGTWNENSYTYTLYANTEYAKEVVYNFTIEGDVLTVDEHHPDQGLGRPYITRKIYQRSDEEPTKAKEDTPVENFFENKDMGGKTVEIIVINGLETGRMSAYCPPGWYFSDIAANMNKIFIIVSEDSMEGVIITCVPREEAKFTIEGEEDENEFGNITWKFRIDEEDENRPKAEFITYIGDSAVIIEGVAYDDLQFILPSIELKWDVEQNNCTICEEKEEDLFNMNMLTTNKGDTARENLIKQMGYDWWIRFKKDGAVTAKLDKSVTRNWGDGFGDTVSGTWKDKMMTFTNGDKTGNLPFKLKGENGDILTITLEDGYVITFRRTND